MQDGTSPPGLWPVTIKPVAGLSHRAMTIVAEAYEVGRRELIRDARTVWRWQGPAEDLVAQVSREHGWAAELTVGYVSALQRVRRGDLPDRGW
jgi:hypothetical protein